MLNQETRFPEKLDFRIGAQVMLIMVRLSGIPQEHTDVIEYEGQYTFTSLPICADIPRNHSS